MASITEILEFEHDRKDVDMCRSVHIFQEGSFYRAYEWSAWLMCRFVHEFKATHRRLKGIEQSVVMIGFPVTSLEKWMPTNAVRRDVGDKHILLRLDDEIFAEFLDENAMEESFQEWKSKFPIVEKQEKPKQDPAIRQVTSLSLVAQKILSFPIESKSLIECAQFLSEIKQELALLY